MALNLDTLFLAGAVVVLIAVVTARFGARIGMPALLLFLGLGMLLGSNLVNIDFENAKLAHDLGFVALAVILAEGGLTTKWSDIRSHIGLAAVLATLGVLVSIALVGLFGYYVLHLPVGVAVLLGAITAPTDAAAVFSVLRGLSLPHRVLAALEGESGLNDAPTVLLVVAATQYVMGVPPEGGPWGLAGMIVLELVGGLVLGLAVGLVGRGLLRRVALPSSGLYPIATMAWAVVAYGLGSVIHLSGFAAVYICAVVLGNSDLPHRHATRSFAEGVGWIAQIGLFVMLGLLAVHEHITWQSVFLAAIAGLFLTLVARPITVWVSAVWFKVPWREQIFLSWAGLRGAVPIILATVPLAAGITDSHLLFGIVFVFVIVFTAIQAPTLPWVAKRLGLIDPWAPYDLDIEVAPLEERRADLLRVSVPQGSKLAGLAVRELRLPPHVIIALVMRGDESFAPHGHTMLRAGDDLLVVTPADLREGVERRLAELGRGGRLSRWLGHAKPSTDTPGEAK
ncbi:MAG: potassium/proton antiporter [Propionibacteriaceae bacterium]|nr:potassium/proton antiporter [Propionibacteriaceae bacterium]